MLVVINPITSSPSTDFNQNGTQYMSYSKASDTPYINKLFNAKMQTMYALLRNNLENKDEKISKNSFACLDCMHSFLIQGLRVKNNFEKLLSNIQSNSDHSLPITDNSLIAINSIDIMTDYESMLYHARSTLDRLSFYIAKQLYNYKRSDNFGENFKTFFSKVHPDTYTFEAYLTLLEVYDSFKGILINFDDGGTGLRSLLAHSKSHDEAIKGNFSIIILSKNDLLFFDQELIKSIGLLESTLKLLNNIPFLLLNLLSIFSGCKDRISLSECQIEWTKIWVSPNDYLTGDVMQTFTKVKLGRTNTTINSVSLNSQILDMKIKITSKH